VQGLRYCAYRGFDSAALGAIPSIDRDFHSTCAMAVRTLKRVVATDIAAEPRFADHLSTAATLHYQAAISTPLTTRKGELQGVLTVHFRQPHTPTDRELHLADLYALLAAHLIERQKAQIALLEADRHKDEFLATLAHELRNPLAPLLNGLQIMKLARHDGNVTEQARTMMERQLAQMVRLIDDLLDLSRVSRGTVDLKKERVALVKVIQQAVEASRPLIEAMGHHFTLEAVPEDIYVLADVTRLAQSFTNLLNNAAKYTERGGQICLTVKQQDRKVVVSVRDTGIGIPANMLLRVFDMFTQVDRSLEQVQRGLGIGLSLVKKLIEMHDGAVEARSDGKGMGSEFVVHLPLLARDRDEPAPEAPPFKQTTSRRFLVVDDNSDAATSLATLLQMSGNTVETVNDGMQAVQKAATYGPQIIVLDIGLPNMNGYDVCRAIREQPWSKGVAIIALSGWGQEEHRRKSKEAGFDAHLVKPVDYHALMDLLASLSDSKTADSE
jgi:signal transduction histidine kinase/ActR/RegA family two-component response regulator